MPEKDMRLLVIWSRGFNTGKVCKKPKLRWGLTINFGSRYSMKTSLREKGFFFSSVGVMRKSTILSTFGRGDPQNVRKWIEWSLEKVPEIIGKCSEVFGNLRKLKTLKSCFFFPQIKKKERKKERKKTQETKRWTKKSPLKNIHYQ